MVCNRCRSFVIKSKVGLEALYPIHDDDDHLYSLELYISRPCVNKVCIELIVVTLAKIGMNGRDIDVNTPVRCATRSRLIRARP